MAKMKWDSASRRDLVRERGADQVEPEVKLTRKQRAAELKPKRDEVKRLKQTIRSTSGEQQRRAREQLGEIYASNRPKRAKAAQPWQPKLRRDR